MTAFMRVCNRLSDRAVSAPPPCACLPDDSLRRVAYVRSLLRRAAGTFTTYLPRHCHAVTASRLLSA